MDSQLENQATITQRTAAYKWQRVHRANTVSRDEYWLGIVWTVRGKQKMEDLILFGFWSPGVQEKWMGQGHFFCSLEVQVKLNAKFHLT